jgi:hypothetical protein
MKSSRAKLLLTRVLAGLVVFLLAKFTMYPQTLFALFE